MEKLQLFEPSQQFTVMEVYQTIKKKQKQKKINNNRSSLPSQTPHSLKVVSPFFQSKNFIRRNYTTHSVQKKEFQPKKIQNFLKKNQGLEEKEKYIEKKIALLKQEKKEHKKREGRKEKFIFLQCKKNPPCNHCCLFKIKCENCKPQLDCFNKKFEQFLKKKKLFFAYPQKVNKENTYQKFQKQILSQIFNFGKLSPEERKAKGGNLMELIQKKIKGFNLKKGIEKSLKNWFYQIYHHFQEELKKKEKIKMKKRRTNFRKQNNKKSISSQNQKIQQKNTEQNYFDIKRIKSSRFSGLNLPSSGDNTKKTRRSAMLIKNQMNCFGSDKGFELSQKKNERNIKKNIDKNGQKDQGIDFYNTSSSQKKVRIRERKKTNVNIKGSFNAKQLISKEGEEFIKRRGNKKNQQFYDFKWDEEISNEQSSVEEEKEKVSEIVQIGEKKKRIGFRINEQIKYFDRQMNILKRKIQKEKQAIKKINEFLDKMGFSELKLNISDSCLTLTRKYRYLRKISCIPPQFMEKYQRYLEVIEKKIQAKLGKLRRKNCQDQSYFSDIQSEEKVNFDVVGQLQLQKCLKFYDLYESANKEVEIKQIDNMNYFKGMFVEHEKKMETWTQNIEKRKIVEKGFFQENEAMGTSRKDILKQKDPGLLIVNPKNSEKRAKTEG